MKYYLLLLATLFAITSCSKDNSDINLLSFEDLGEPIQVRGNEVTLSDSVYGLFYMHLNDTLVIGSTLQEKNIYWVFQDGKILGNFGQVGNGPNELSYPTHIYDGSAGMAYIYDSDLLLLKKIDLNKSLETNELTVINEFELPKELGSTKNIFLINENLLVGIYDDHFAKKLDQKRGLYYYNPLNKNFELDELYNSSIYPYEVMPATNINAKIPAISPDKSKLAIAGYYNPVIELYDINRRTHKILQLGDEDLLDQYKLDDYKEGNLVQHYKFVHATDQKVYLLYEGVREKETEGNIEYLQVIDWEGEPIGHYTIPDTYNLTSFYITEDDKLVGHSYISEKIYEIDLNALE